MIWYKETKLELLKVAQTCLPRLKPKIQKMQTAIYNIQIYVPNRTNDKFDKLIWNNNGLDNSGELLYRPTNLRDMVQGNKSELLKVVQTCLPGLKPSRQRYTTYRYTIAIKLSIFHLITPFRF